MQKVDALERDILQENVKLLANNIIIAKTFSDEVRMANKKRAQRLLSFHNERIINEKAAEIHEKMKNELIYV